MGSSTIFQVHLLSEWFSKRKGKQEVWDSDCEPLGLEENIEVKMKEYDKDNESDGELDLNGDSSGNLEWEYDTYGNSN